MKEIILKLRLAKGNEGIQFKKNRAWHDDGPYYIVNETFICSHISRIGELIDKIKIEEGEI